MVKTYFWQIISAILFVVLLVTCHKTKPDDIVIVTPPKTGVFKLIAPEPIKVPKYIYRTLKGDTITLNNPVNLELAHKYEELSKVHDSVKTRLAYLEAIQIRQYHKEFTDKNLRIFVDAQTTGTLDSIGVEYTIKPDTIKVHIPKERFALLLGGGLYNSGAKINLGVQINSRHLISGSYDPINQRVFLDYNIKIFNFNK